MYEKVEGVIKNKGGESKYGKTQVTMSDLAQYNDRLVNEKDSDQLSLRKYLCHERLYQMMKSESISKDNSLWNYLEHFSEDQDERIHQLSAHVEDGNRKEGPKSASYVDAFLNNCFSDSDGE